nr:peptide ABC transporter substrate-binding protein [Paenibacillus sacheonensis]
MAAGWTVSADGRTYTFTLRAGARWSNKQPVKASDFEYAWKNSLAPASIKPTVYKLYVLENAESYNTGSLKDDAKIGVKAVDEHTLRVTLKEPLAYFPRMLAEPIFDPVYAPGAKADPGWAQRRGDLATNGPFKLMAWDESGVKLAKNADYYDAASVHFATVRFDASTGESQATRYGEGKLDWFDATGMDLASILVKSAVAMDTAMEAMPSGSTYYYQINLNKRPFTNLNIRKALAMAIDRRSIGYGTPAFGFVADGIAGAKQSFRAEVPDGAYFAEDAALARQLLAKGLAEEGLKKLPPIAISLNAGAHESVAKTVAAAWKRNLGVSASVKVLEWGELLKNRREQHFDIARAGWGADYNDPASFLTYFSSWSADNDSGWSSPAYDAILRQANRTTDIVARNKLYARAEKQLMDNMVLLPLYYYVSNIVHRATLKQVYLDSGGSVAYTRGYFEK